MGEEKEDSPTPEIPPLLEVTCTSSGKVRRFAPGVKAGFAVSLINHKLETGDPLALYIEGAKENEEPISFGPDSLLVNYGIGWKLQTVVDSAGVKKNVSFEGLNMSRKAKGVKSQPMMNFVYIGKIIIAFIFIFLLGAIFTLALDNLPRFISFINSAL